jgi:Ser/Thr protein kinase RdoA (MazF antagonist)
VTATAHDAWTAAVAAVTTAAAEQIAARDFGLRVTATALVSERDQNFSLQEASGRRCVLKLTHPAENRAYTRWQTEALLTIAAGDPALPVPRLASTGKGAAFAEVVTSAGAAPRIARVMSFLPGLSLHRAPADRHPHPAIGSALARLQLALAPLAADAAPRDMLWDLRRAPLLREYLPHIADTGKRTIVSAVLDRLAAQTLPALAQLPAQAIHNDFQPWNLLVDEADASRISGIIDFGDMVCAPPVMDLAVACAYHVADAPAGQPLADVAAIVSGYAAVRPLPAAERDLLPGLIAGRLAMTLAITNWRAALHPDNAAYILRNAGVAWTGLERLAASGDA